MSIEEKTREYCSETSGTPFAYDIEIAFREGAQWMRSRLTEEAIEWLKHQMNKMGISWPDGFGVRFRKAMEE